MVNTALIGHTGYIGSKLLDFINFDRCYNSATIKSLMYSEVDTLYCAAPSGNRLKATQDPMQDTVSVETLISVLNQTKVSKFVLISTVDTLYAPQSVYGKNRLMLEQFVKSRYNDYHIVRLCVLIDSDIKKNVLYDIKHKQFLDSINAQAVNQWYPLQRLKQDISWVINAGIKEINLVSEPVSNQDLFPDFSFKISNVSRPYALVSGQADNYIVSKKQVQDLVMEYLNDNNS